MLPDINWIAAIFAGLAGFFAGALWYSPYMFHRAWTEEMAGILEHGGTVSKAVQLGTGAVLSVISAIVFALVLGPDQTLRFTLSAALAIVVAWIIPAFAIQYLFEGRSVRLLAINGGYHCVQFAIIGLVLGLWH